ncbi:MAG: pirin family protein [Rhodospirillaceae bacterium]|nr:pirin family protein [Rhodospirillaceae bacterium]MBT6118688.1 pirin family protein [Rhodospirillaceae bacterium]
MTLDHVPFDTLGRMDIDWLQARYHFSFANYRDPERQGLGPLLVWNDDTIRAGGGFPMHGHRDMEIVTYVRSGAISHEDHLGNRGRTEAGDVQVMSAGTGIMHAEFNREDEPTTLFQIWIEPRTAGAPPRWEARRFPAAVTGGGPVALASGRDPMPEGALWIDQDATLYGATLIAGDGFEHELEPGRRAYLVAESGRHEVNGIELGPRDGLRIAEADTIAARAVEDGRIVFLDLP